MNLGVLREAKFIERINRFVGVVELRGRRRKALIRNTGRLRELLRSGNRVYVRDKSGGKLSLEIVLAEVNGNLVCIDSHLPPRLLIEYLRREGRPWDLDEVRCEFMVGGSRFDLLINGRVLVETKSVNLVENGTALFPDAPTERGRRHIHHLINLADSFLPSLVFVVQREDAEIFSPNKKVDPPFARAVDEFCRMGYPVYAFLCRVSKEEIYIWKEIPVRIK